MSLVDGWSEVGWGGVWPSDVGQATKLGVRAQIQPSRLRRLAWLNSRKPGCFNWAVLLVFISAAWALIKLG